ncbi:MAG: hypothetical protein ACP5RF_03750 [Candidatus Micrarchaeia archaeon]
MARKVERVSYSERLDRIFHPISEEKLKRLEEAIDKGEFKPADRGAIGKLYRH